MSQIWRNKFGKKYSFPTGELIYASHTAACGGNLDLYGGTSLASPSFVNLPYSVHGSSMSVPKVD